jgi:glutamine synthetase
MCRPALANMASSGWHLHQSLADKRTGANAFMSSRDEDLLAPVGQQFLAGLLAHAPGACIFSTPTINGYKRYRPYSLAPNRIVWGRENRGAMVRVIGAPRDPVTHLENRIGEPAANPYLYFVSQLVSGMDGMQRGLIAPKEVDTPYEGGGEVLPRSLVAAIAELKRSELFRTVLGDGFVDYFLTIKEAEVQRFLSEEVTDWEQREYFEIF